MSASDFTGSVPVSESGNDLVRRVTATRIKEQIIQGILFLCAFLSVLTTVGIVVALFSESIFSFDSDDPAFFQEVSVVEFFTSTKWTPQYTEKHFGILPLLCGTMLVAAIAGIVGIPIGLTSAIYLGEYASPAIRRKVKPVLEILAGVPTVIYGYFALVFITPILQEVLTEKMGIDVNIFNALSAGIVVGIMIIPMVASLSEDALRAVPQGLREAGYALGSTKYDVSVKVVVPAAFSGILASFLLAISRAMGETMAVTIAAGQQARMSLNPLQSVETMTAYIVNVSLGDSPAGTIEYKSLYAVALTLFVITLSMNILSHSVMRRFREEYQ